MPDQVNWFEERLLPDNIANNILCARGLPYLGLAQRGSHPQATFEAWICQGAFDTNQHESGRDARRTQK